jgi:hypothetical protein
MEDVIKALLAYGSAPAIIFLAFLVGLLIKQLTENAKKDEGRDASLREFVATQVKDLEKRSEDRLAAQQESVYDLAQRLSCVERDYLPRDEHYRDFSGWRGEIRSLGKKIDDFILMFAGKFFKGDGK